MSTPVLTSGDAELLAATAKTFDHRARQLQRVWLLGNFWANDQFAARVEFRSSDHV
jgi:hypothetical protein